MTDTEQQYAQIEKEALAVTWGCEKFQEYLLGTTFKVETDHKPLVPLLSSKALDVVPVRVQRFRLCLMRYSFTIVHVPGKELHTADTLSRAPVSKGEDSREEAFCHEVQAYVNAVVENLPATDARLHLIRDEQNIDPVCCKLKEYCEKGEIDWTGPVKQYFQVRTELTMLRIC